MNPNGILTTYEERMKANLQRYQHPEKAGTFRLRLDHRTWGKHMCLFCYFTDMDTSEKIRLACWRGAGERYAPRKSDIDFAKVRDRTVLALHSGSKRVRHHRLDRRGAAVN